MKKHYLIGLATLPVVPLVFGIYRFVKHRAAKHATAEAATNQIAAAPAKPSNKARKQARKRSRNHHSRAQA